MSDVSGYLIVSAKSCHDIMCESVPGSPLRFNFVGARGEPGNEAICSFSKVVKVTHQNYFYSRCSTGNIAFSLDMSSNSLPFQVMSSSSSDFQNCVVFLQGISL